MKTFYAVISKDELDCPLNKLGGTLSALETNFDEAMSKVHKTHAYADNITIKIVKLCIDNNELIKSYTQIKNTTPEKIVFEEDSTDTEMRECVAGFNEEKYRIFRGKFMGIVRGSFQIEFLGEYFKESEKFLEVLNIKHTPETTTKAIGWYGRRGPQVRLECQNSKTMSFIMTALKLWGVIKKENLMGHDQGWTPNAHTIGIYMPPWDFYHCVEEAAKERNEASSKHLATQLSNSTMRMF